MEQNQPTVISTGDSGSGAWIAVLVIVIIAVAAFFAYKKGYLGGKPASSDQPTININIPGTSPAK